MKKKIDWMKIGLVVWFLVIVIQILKMFYGLSVMKNTFTAVELVESNFFFPYINLLELYFLNFTIIYCTMFIYTNINKIQKN